MLFYLIEDGVKITENTHVKAYDLPIQEYGSARNTLSIGDIVEIEEGLIKITDYSYSYILNKGIYEYRSLGICSSKRVPELDLNNNAIS